MKPFPVLLRSGLALIVWQVFIGQVGAVTNTFTIDPARSHLTLSGDVSGSPLNPQGPGSLSNVFAGTVVLDVTPTTIQFVGGSLIDPPTNGVWAPLAGGAAGTAPADFAGTANIIVVTAQAALRNLLLDVTGPVLPLANGGFDSSSMVFQFLTNSGGSLDYRVTGFLPSAGSRVLDGLSTNSVSTGASLTNNGALYTLVVPIDATQLLTLIQSNDSTLRIQGQLVATAPAGAPPLVISVRIEGAQIVLEWPNAAAPSFVVETTQDFTGWVPASGTTTVGATTTTWTSAIGVGSSYYRVLRN